MAVKHQNDHNSSCMLFSVYNIDWSREGVLHEKGIIIIIILFIILNKYKKLIHSEYFYRLFFKTYLEIYWIS